jgi:hypothetical protein
MNRLCCEPCRMRFSVLGESYLTACPECERPLTPSPARQLLGFRLFDPRDGADVLPAALAVSLPAPPPRRSP